MQGVEGNEMFSTGVLTDQGYSVQIDVEQFSSSSSESDKPVIEQIDMHISRSSVKPSSTAVGDQNLQRRTRSNQSLDRGRDTQDHFVPQIKFTSQGRLELFSLTILMLQFDLVAMIKVSRRQTCSVIRVKNENCSKISLIAQHLRFGHNGQEIGQARGRLELRSAFQRSGTHSRIIARFCRRAAPSPFLLLLVDSFSD
ncbi:hypothetical protein J6590_011400 [Homalodisca vitripennis]|nr:hypothetical protein J6590_011400 [Homalodisca vitripennis]